MRIGTLKTKGIPQKLIKQCTLKTTSHICISRITYLLTSQDLNSRFFLKHLKCQSLHHNFCKCAKVSWILHLKFTYMNHFNFKDIRMNKPVLGDSHPLFSVRIDQWEPEMSTIKRTKLKVLLKVRTVQILTWQSILERDRFSPFWKGPVLMVKIKNEYESYLESHALRAWVAPSIWCLLSAKSWNLIK